MQSPTKPLDAQRLNDIRVRNKRFADGAGSAGQATVGAQDRALLLAELDRIEAQLRNRVDVRNAIELCRIEGDMPCPHEACAGLSPHRPLGVVCYRELCIVVCEATIAAEVLKCFELQQGAL